jgi:hypothetical protein
VFSCSERFPNLSCFAHFVKRLNVSAISLIKPGGTNYVMENRMTLSLRLSSQTGGSTGWSKV